MTSYSFCLSTSQKPFELVHPHFYLPKNVRNHFNSPTTMEALFRLNAAPLYNFPYMPYITTNNITSIQTILIRIVLLLCRRRHFEKMACSCHLGMVRAFA